MATSQIDRWWFSALIIFMGVAALFALMTLWARSVIVDGHR